MYLGKIVEVGSRDEIFSHARHPYTQTLLSSVPLPDPQRRDRPRIPVLGEPPSATRLPTGCRFHPRCWKAKTICTTHEPELTRGQSGDHVAACHFPQSPAEALADATGVRKHENSVLPAVIAS